jgi:hypothetical protein
MDAVVAALLCLLLWLSMDAVGIGPRCNTPIFANFAVLVFIQHSLHRLLSRHYRLLLIYYHHDHRRRAVVGLVVVDGAFAVVLRPHF